jgi:hypothetical protein
MEIIGVVSFFLSIIFLILSLDKLIGFGWAMFIIDMLTFQTSANYAQLQKDYPKNKTRKGKTLGFIFLILAFVFISMTIVFIQN